MPPVPSEMGSDAGEGEGEAMGTAAEVSPSDIGRPSEGVLGTEVGGDECVEEGDDEVPPAAPPPPPPPPPPSVEFADVAAPR